ncbi:ABC transporter ATP-binding protein [Erythrobacter sp. HA6-11]
MANTSAGKSNRLSLREFFQRFFQILRPEAKFYWLAIVYGIGISLFSLATPISVQFLINTVANTGLAAPLVVLSATLFVLLLMFGLLNALRVHLMELFARRFYARMVAEISLISTYAQNPFFADNTRIWLFNRYFDVIGVEKAIPVLFIGGFTVVLQVFVGFVLVSLYHPLFLVFTLVVSALIWAIWLTWGSRAIRTGIELSHAKHATAAWLESLGASNGFFKSQRRVDYAFDRTDDHTKDYIDQHKAHFRNHFAQTISFLVLYAAASAALLGLGGWLVIQGQLSLGQLVAAELVLSVAFFGVSQLGNYLTYFYDLCAAIEELSLFYEVEQETPSGSSKTADLNATLVFNQVGGKARHEDALFDFEIPSGSTVMAATSHHGVQRLFTSLIKMHVLPTRGFATLGGIDMADIEAHQLRRLVHVLERPSFVGMTIRNYLHLAIDSSEYHRIVPALETVGLMPAISTLEKGLDTEIASTGWPLSPVELQMLKLANALLEQPRILILSRLFDLIDEDHLAAAIAEMRANRDTTVVHFSNRRIDLGFDRFLFIEASRQRYFERFEDFCLAVNGKPPREASGPRLIDPDTLGQARP